MKMSQLIGHTRKEVPALASARSHELLLRAAYIHQVAAGIFSYLPLGLRVMQNISAILRQEMEAIGAQEINMPVVQPAELWRQSGRWDKIGAELGRFVDRRGCDMVLAMTHEEVTADLVRQFVHSYRDLPRLVYHIQTKWRDDARPRAGLIRVREFVMKDSYSLDSSQQGLKQQYRNHYRAYFRIFGRCALPVRSVRSASGMMGGSMAHEFMYASDVGEDTILFCASCGYSANRQIARFAKPEQATPPLADPLADLEEVATPECKTIAQLSKFLQVAPERCAKMVFFMAQLARSAAPNSEVLVAAVLPGNMELSQSKLSALLEAVELRPAEEAEIRAAGAVPGYASPCGLGESGGSDRQDCLVVADELIVAGRNWICGANRQGYHLRGLNYQRDFTAQYTGDICAAAAGHACIACGAVLDSTKAVEVGNIFQLGSFYSKALGCYFTAEDGKQKPVFMGSYGIGVGRLAACIAEQHCDADGLVWPISVAPFQVQLILLKDKKNPEIERLAQQVYSDLQAAGIEVLFDERTESPGFKFKDADLIGIPIRLTLSARSLQSGGLEFSLRKQKQKGVFWGLEEVAAHVQQEIAHLQAEIDAGVRDISLPESA